MKVEGRSRCPNHQLIKARTWNEQESSWLSRRMKLDDFTKAIAQWETAEIPDVITTYSNNWAYTFEYVLHAPSVSLYYLIYSSE